MTVLGLILTRYWKPLTVFALVAALLIYRGILVRERDRARGQVAELSQQNAALRASNQAFTSEITRQNAAVAQLKNQADAAANAMAANERAAALAGLAAENQAQQEASALSRATIDPSSGCDGAIRWANARAAELATW